MIWFQSQVDRILKGKDEEIVYWKEMCAIEKKRADNAVDQMLISAGQRPVSPAQTPEKSRFEVLIDEASRGLAMVGGEMNEEEAAKGGQ